MRKPDNVHMDLELVLVLFVVVLVLISRFEVQNLNDT